MRPLHEMINRPQNVRTLDEVEFKNTHINHLNNADNLIKRLADIRPDDAHKSDNITEREKEEGDHLMGTYRIGSKLFES
jgi:hypothetical protein